MKVIIAGSRDITDYSLVCRAISESKFDITEVISGTARGVDTLGEKWAVGAFTFYARRTALSLVCRGMLPLFLLPLN